MPDLPTGTVTFLFTDIAGSTRLWEHHPDAMRPSLARHAALLHSAIDAHAGHVFKTVGDAFCAAFQTAPDALAAALAAQRALAAEPWPEVTPIRVRIGLHTGVADAEGGDYFGQTLNRVARLMSAGHGGQTLLSAAAWELVRDDLPEGVTLRDLGERRLKDLRRPERVFQVLSPDLPADFPPLTTLDARPNNLPVQLTSFVGRGREMAEVKRLLGAAHLVTLTGVGGTGKTRLALQVAADLIDDFDHGVWFVDLAPLTDSSLVASTVATVLGVKEVPGRTVEDALVDGLKAKRLLLILDNCEHLVAVCADLADAVLRSAPGVRILATSREALSIAGEATMAVAPLAAPGLSSATDMQTKTAESLTQFDSVRLFIDRAVAARSDFVVTNANAPAVASICHRLDGVPLAIELAAARVRALAPDQIAMRLDDRFRLLQRGGRTAMPRQQTLRAAIDWSHDLLHESERVLFRSLAVFQGGWTLEAAEGVCAGDDLDEIGILELLTNLVEKSLVQVETETVPPRYRFLETIREYAAERLAMAGEAEVLRDRHLGWHVRLVADVDLGRGNPDLAGLINGLKRERDNLRAALIWGLADPGRVEHAVVLIRSAGAAWDFREGLELHARTHRIALEIGLDATHPRDFGWVSHGLANSLRATGALDQAEACAEEAHRCFERSDEQRGMAWNLNTLAIIAAERGEFARAEKHALASLALLRGIGVAPGEIGALINTLGEVARVQGDFAQALNYYRECLAMNPNDMWAVHNLGHVLLRQGEVAGSTVHFGHSLSIARQLEDLIILASTLGGYAGVAAARHQAQRSARLFGAAAKLLEQSGGVLEGADQLDWDHNLAAARAQLNDAEWDSEWVEGAALTVDEVVAYARLQAADDFA